MTDKWMRINWWGKTKFTIQERMTGGRRNEGRPCLVDREEEVDLLAILEN